MQEIQVITESDLNDQTYSQKEDTASIDLYCDEQLNSSLLEGYHSQTLENESSYSYTN